MFLPFEAITQCPVVEKIVRLRPAAPTGLTKSHLNGSFSDLKTDRRSGSSCRKAIRPALNSETPASRSYCPTGGWTLSSVIRSA